MGRGRRRAASCWDSTVSFVVQLIVVTMLAFVLFVTVDVILSKKNIR